MDSLVKETIDKYKQWLLGATRPRSLVLPKATFDGPADRNYSLKNKESKLYLQHEKQTFGINLGWTDDGSNQTGDKVARWFFVRSGKGAEPVRFGETIAIGNGGKPSFIRYEEREFGINLGYSDSPVFEWKLLGGKLGDPVHTQEWIAILNEKSEGGECLIYFDRNVGANIGWPSSQRWEDKWLGELKKRFKDLTKEAWEEAKKEAVKALIIGALA